MISAHKGVSKKTNFLALMLMLTIIVIFSYLIVRTSLFFIAPLLWQEKIVAFLLLCAEFFILVHSFGYFLNIYHVLTNDNDESPADHPAHPLTTFPPVAIIVSSYQEPLAVVEDTLICFYNLTYPNKHLYFLDDTRYDLVWANQEEMDSYRKEIDDLCKRLEVNLFRRKWHGAKAGMINDFLQFVEGQPLDGFTFEHYAQGERSEKEKYIIVFDADMNAIPDFVEPLVALMEARPTLAFVQTPQYYSNFEFNRVARASGLQQAVFYEYICEGKSMQDAMFCCGTNVIFRREALMDVGGFDETSVTEDFATSLKFHVKHWRSAYINKVCAFGLGPEDLGGYFKQQFRWALGTVGLFRTILGQFLRHPTQLSAAKWWEYFLSGTHYFVGWVFLIMAVCPLLYIYFELPSFFARPEIYFSVFLPYIILSLTMFIGTLSQRKYTLKDLVQGLLLNAICFPVYIKAATLAMFGFRGSFGITPKGQSKSLPLFALWPHLLVACLCLGAVVWGGHRLYYERQNISAILVNTFWCFYHLIILSTLLYFNHPEETD